MSFVKYEPKGNIAYLIIDREKALNALNSQVLADLDAALDAVDLSEIRCLIVRGAGEKSFVAGADIAQMKELSKEEAEAFGKQGNDVMRKLEAFPIPTIAAVGGYALGGGCELSLCADIRIASEKAKFGQPEVGLGIIPGFGGTQRLTRTVNRAYAADLILSARTVSAAEALQMGLVSRVVPPEELMNEAMKLAEMIAANAPIAVRAAKKAMRIRYMNSLDNDLAAEAELFGSCFETQDQQMAMTAFVSKTKKDEFTGK